MAENRIKIRGLGNIILKGENPEPSKEYLISIKAELRKIEKDITDKDDPFYTFIMEYLNTELVQEIGASKKLEVQKGKTLSQKLRFAIQDLARIQGIDEDNFYQSEMSKLINNYEEKLT